MRLISAGSQVRILPRPPVRERGVNDNRKVEGIEKKQTTTVLRMCDGRDSGIQTNSEPEEFGWFFDIYIQGSNTTFLELSLKREFQLS